MKNLNVFSQGERWNIAAENPYVVRKLSQRLSEMASQVLWTDSQMERGNSHAATPCCNKASSK